MARELLNMMLPSDADQKSKRIRPAEIERGVHHDLESFILVLFYAAMKRGLESGVWGQHPQIHGIRRLYRQLFGGHTIEEITTGRSGLVDPVPDCLFLAVDLPMFQLLYGCRTLLARQYSRPSTHPFANLVDKKLQRSSSTQHEVITYETLYSVYDLAIGALPKMK
jgi:hypothetical protein